MPKGAPENDKRILCPGLLLKPESGILNKLNTDIASSKTVRKKNSLRQMVIRFTLFPNRTTILCKPLH
jgi:hypothetical protein